MGVNVAPVEPLTLRATWFDNRVEDPITNVTITPDILAQRQNIGRTRIRGLQTDVEYRFGSTWRAGGSYVLNRARVTENPSDPTLVDKYLPQVPRNRGSLHFAYMSPKYADVTVTSLIVGHQFDDDQNARTKPGETEPGLPAFGVVDLSAMRAIGRTFDVFLTVQNLFDQEYWVQLAPTTIAAPRLVSAGFRVRFSGR